MFNGLAPLLRSATEKETGPAGQHDGKGRDWGARENEQKLLERWLDFKWRLNCFLGGPNERVVKGSGKAGFRRKYARKRRGKGQGKHGRDYSVMSVDKGIRRDAGGGSERMDDDNGRLRTITPAGAGAVLPRQIKKCKQHGETWKHL